MASLQSQPHSMSRASPSGANAVGTTWLFGAMPSTGSCGPTPFGLSLLKCLYAGKMRIWTCDALQLNRAMTTLGWPTTLNGMQEILLGLDDGKHQQLEAEGCKVRFAVMSAGECLYIPAGWILAEHAEGTLIYGARKTCAFATKKMADSYDALVDLNKKSGKATAKMQQVAEKPKLQLWSPGKSAESDSCHGSSLVMDRSGAIVGVYNPVRWSTSEAARLVAPECTSGRFLHSSSFEFSLTARQRGGQPTVQSVVPGCRL